MFITVGPQTRRRSFLEDFLRAGSMVRYMRPKLIKLYLPFVKGMSVPKVEADEKS